MLVQPVASVPQLPPLLLIETKNKALLFSHQPLSTRLLHTWCSKLFKQPKHPKPHLPNQYPQRHLPQAAPPASSSPRSTPSLIFPKKHPQCHLPKQHPQCHLPQAASFTAHNTPCTHCIDISHYALLLSMHMTDVLFLVQFNNFARTMGFYWSYTLLL